MQLQTLGSGMNSVAAGSTFTELTSPFREGGTAVYMIDFAGFTGTVKIQSSDNGTDWTDEVTATGASASDASTKGTVTLARYMRANMTARTAGAADVHLLAD